MSLDLEALYDEYNAKYFDNELPKIPVRWGRTDPAHAAEFWSDTMEIVVHPVIKRCGLFRYARQLLLHEMAHVKLRNRRIKDHGRVFKNEMKRLVQIGAMNELL